MVTEHICIVFAEEHYNPLGVVRSLGENGIRPVGIFIESKDKLASKSKYLSQVFYVKDREEGCEVLLKHFGNEVLKPYVFTSDDITTSFLDQRYDLLKDKFIFFNGGSTGKITHYMGKDSEQKRTEVYPAKEATLLTLTGETILADSIRLE